MDGRMRAWRKAVAGAMEEKRLASLRLAASRAPGANVEEALALSAWASTFAASMESQPASSLAERWRRLHSSA